MDIKDENGKVVAKVAKNSQVAFWSQAVEQMKRDLTNLENSIDMTRFMLKNAEKHLKELER